MVINLSHIGARYWIYDTRYFYFFLIYIAVVQPQLEFANIFGIYGKALKAWNGRKWEQ